MSFTHIHMTDALFAYLRDVSLRDQDLLRRLREETASLPRARMQITPEQGQLMALLIQLMGARKALEIGVFTGYSALNVALALPEDGKLIACDVSAEWTSIGRRYWKEAGVEHKIDLRLAPAVETLDTLIREGHAGSFDFAFIDADKTNSEHYYERSLVLVRKGGLIVIDNVLWHGDVIDPSMANDEETQVIRRLNEKIHADGRVALSMLPMGDGITLALKR